MSGGGVGRGGVGLVVFRLGGERYAVPLACVRELSRVPPITPIPRLPAFVAGVVNLRGNVLGLIDLRYAVEAEGSANPEDRRMMVVNVEGVTAGFLVDSVEGVVEAEAELDPPVPTLSDALRPFTRGHLRHGHSPITVLEPAIVPALRARVESEAG